jgi:Sulfotransferase domain
MLNVIRKISKMILPNRAVSNSKTAYSILGNTCNTIKINSKEMVGVLPDFLVIGSQKCGTTSFYNYLTNHPCIYPSTKKEIGFFDRRPNITLNWYKSHFPSLFYKFYAKNILRHKCFLTGEASTGYILYPHALQRISSTLPNVKLILLLRNPVDRAYSHYQHTFRIGKEKLSFEIAIQKERERVASDWDKLRTEPNFFSTNIYLYSYCFIGEYFEQVEKLFELFIRKNILILQSEELFENPKNLLRKTFRFLDIPSYDIKHYKQFNPGSYKEMDPKIRKDLITHFKPYNERLFNLLGESFSWNQ